MYTEVTQSLKPFTRYARVRFPQKDGLSKTYDYKISEKLASMVSPGDYVVIQSARTDYAVGVLHEVVGVVEDPSIVTKDVIQLVDAPKCRAYTIEKINLGGNEDVK